MQHVITFSSVSVSHVCLGSVARTQFPHARAYFSILHTFTEDLKGFNNCVQCLCGYSDESDSDLPWGSSVWWERKSNELLLITYVDIGTLEPNAFLRPPVRKGLWRLQNLGEGVSWTLKDEEGSTKERNPLGYLLGACYIRGDSGLWRKAQLRKYFRAGVPSPRHRTVLVHGRTAGGEQQASERSFICRSPSLVLPPEPSYNQPPPTPVHGKIVFHETSPWCQKGWGLLL